MKARAHIRLVLEENLDLLSLCLEANLRILLLQPALHERDVLLISSKQQPPACQPKLRQESSGRHKTYLDEEVLGNDGADLRPRPQCEGEFERKWILGRHSVINPANLLRYQALRPAHRFWDRKASQPPQPDAGNQMKIRFA